MNHLLGDDDDELIVAASCDLDQTHDTVLVIRKGAHETVESALGEAYMLLDAYDEQQETKYTS